ncbi:MAG: glycosyltransferase [Deltaproteobacteria bacterium]|nr:glycosyltransferase [Deltaproteobacteria bacterium]
MKINVLTPYRKGGPYTWGENLVRELNRRDIRARHIHRIPELLASPFFKDCDIIHTAVPLPFNFWNKPIVLTVHGDYRREKNIWQKFYPLAVKRADCVTVPSEFLKKELGIERAVVIPNGVETASYPENKPFDLNHLKFVTVTNFNF